MPRKLFKIESAPKPAERLGSGMRRKPQMEEPKVIIDPGYREEMEAPEERHARLQGMVGELVGMEKGRMEEEKRTRAKREQLVAERTDIQQRIKEMGGIWGEESYFLLNDRLEEVGKELSRMEGPPKSRMPIAEKVSSSTGEVQVAGEMAPADRVADARKSLKELNKERREIDAAQRRVMAVLRNGGMGNVGDIEAELEGMGEELRGEVSGAKPSFGYRMHKVLRGLMGYERPPEVEEALKGYLELEQRGNANLRASHEAEALLTGAEAATGKKRSPRLRVGRSPEAPATHLDMSGFVRTFTEGPEAAMGGEHVGQELEALKHLEKGSLSREPRIRVELKELEEEIQDRILNIARREVEAIEPGDAGRYNGIWEDLYARARALEEEAGSNPKLVKGLQDVEAALVQYHELIKRRLTAMGELAQVAEASIRARGKSEEGKARPESAIRQRNKTDDSYGGGEQRRTVELHTKEQPDSSKRDLATERMKAVMEYRSGANRAVPLAEINKEPAVRAKMHKIYEDFNARWNALIKEGDEKAMSLQTSVDPALDYALNVYKALAKQEGKFRYGSKERDQALERIEEANAALGWGPVENVGKDMEALFENEGPSLGNLVERSTKARKERAKRELDAEPIPLTRKKVKIEEQPLPHVKEATSERKQREIEDEEGRDIPVLDIPITVEEPVQKNRKWVEPTQEEVAKFDAEGNKAFEKSLTDRPAKQEEVMHGPEFSEKERAHALREWFLAGANKEGYRSGGWVKLRDGELRSADSAKMVNNPDKGGMNVAIRYYDSNGKERRATMSLVDYRSAQDEGGVPQVERIKREVGRRKAVRETQAFSDEQLLESMNTEMEAVKDEPLIMADINSYLKKFSGETPAEKLLSLLKEYQLTRPEGQRKGQLLKLLNRVRAILGKEEWKPEEIPEKPSKDKARHTPLSEPPRKRNRRNG